jgi:hypothetical protein
MASQSKGKQSSKGQQKIPWMWIALGALVVLAVASIIWREQTRQTFILTEGDKTVVVLIRTDDEGYYRLQYVGKKLVEVRSLVVMLRGEILHMDVQQVVIAKDGQEWTLQQGKLPSDVHLTLKDGETFDVRVTFHGQSLGRNLLWGFRLGYMSGQIEKSLDVVVDPEYLIAVE